MIKHLFYLRTLTALSLLAMAFSLDFQLSIFSLEQWLLFTVTILFHLPALLTVPRFRELTGYKVNDIKFPEVVFCSLLLIFWIYLALIINITHFHLALSVIILIDISLASAGTRLLTAANNQLRMVTVFYGTTGSAKILSTGKLYLYFFRTLGVLFSLMVAMMLIMEVVLPVQSMLLIAVTLTFGIVTVFLTSGIEAQNSAQEIKVLAKRLANLKYTETGITTAIYSSNPKAVKFMAERKLVKALNEEGISVGAIIRENKGANLLAKEGVDPVFYAPTIDSLDNFASEQLQTIFYTNDSQKNGHFVRFSHLKHILLPNLNLSKADRLPKAFGMYDAVIAPSLNKANTWAQNRGVQNETPIVVIESMSDFRLPFEARKDSPEEMATSIYFDPAMEGVKDTIVPNALKQIASEWISSNQATLTIMVKENHPLTDMFIAQFTEQMAIGSHGRVQILSGTKQGADQVGVISLIIKAAEMTHINHPAIYLTNSSGSVAYVPGKLIEALDAVSNLTAQQEKAHIHPSVQSFKNFEAYLGSLHVEHKL